MLVDYKGNQTKYFADCVNDTINMTGGYDWAYFNQKLPKYKKITRVTNIIDLQKTEDEIFSQFNPTCRNEIHKAEKLEDIKINFEANLGQISDITARMFKSKGLFHVPESEYHVEDETLRYCIVLEWHDILIAHSYFVDKEHKLVLLRTSGSEFRGKEQEYKKYYSNLNRYLHWREIQFFKEKGFLYYDFGGLGFLQEYKSGKSAVQGIIKFKESFGGEIRYVYRYERINYKEEIKKILLFIPMRLVPKRIKKIIKDIFRRNPQ